MLFLEVVDLLKSQNLLFLAMLNREKQLRSPQAVKIIPKTIWSTETKLSLLLNITSCHSSLYLDPFKNVDFSSVFVFEYMNTGEFACVIIRQYTTIQYDIRLSNKA